MNNVYHTVMILIANGVLVVLSVLQAILERLACWLDDAIIYHTCRLETTRDMLEMWAQRIGLDVPADTTDAELRAAIRASLRGVRYLR